MAIRRQSSWEKEWELCVSGGQKDVKDESCPSGSISADLYGHKKEHTLVQVQTFCFFFHILQH